MAGPGELSYQDVVDTRMLRGGPALRWHDYFEARLPRQRRLAPRLGARARQHSWARDDDSRAWSSGGGLNLRLSNRLSLSGSASYEWLLDNLQYVATADADGDPRWVLGRIDQDTWSFTFRVNLSITPDLTVQYYGSPFIGTGRYTAFKKATDTLAQANADRFHLYGPDEIAFRAEDNSYRVTEAGGGPSYSFANPDFSFRQFRSNLVARWEWKPGSSLYVVWSQGRTAYAPDWDGSFGANWDALWGAPAGQRLPRQAQLLVLAVGRRSAARSCRPPSRRTSPCRPRAPAPRRRRAAGERHRADAHRHPRAVLARGLLDAGAQLDEGRLRRVPARLREEDHELVAAHAPDEVGRAARPAHGARDRHEHGVAPGVAEAVVDRLEVVEVDVGQGQRVPVARRAGELDGRRLVEAPPVQQAGQAVRPADGPLAPEPVALRGPEEGDRPEGDGHDGQVREGDDGLAALMPARWLDSSHASAQAAAVARPGHAPEAQRDGEDGEEVEGEDAQLDAGGVVDARDGDHEDGRAGEHDGGRRLPGPSHARHCSAPALADPVAAGGKPSGFGS